MFRPPTGEEADFVKRVIGIPGDEIDIRQGAVWINGVKLDEDRITRPRGSTDFPTTVPPDSYFVLGDNRNSSSDSHNHFGIANHSGMLPKENIIGQAWLIYWPSSGFGLVDNTSVTPGAGAQDSTESAAGKLAAVCP